MAATADDLVVAFLIEAAWPDDEGEHPDQTRCRLCESIHRVSGGVRGDGRPCQCPCHAARDYLARIGRYDEVHDHWQPKRTE